MEEEEEEGGRSGGKEIEEDAVIGRGGREEGRCSHLKMWRS